MATNAPATYIPPVATVFTELWWSHTETATVKTQIFGVQALPPVITPKEDITYRTLESPTEFAVKGVRPFETIEVETILFVDQYKELEIISNSDEELWWFIKLPDSQEMVIKWRGSIDISLAEVTLDDMLRSILKIGKSTDPVILDALPT